MINTEIKKNNKLLKNKILKDLNVLYIEDEKEIRENIVKALKLLVRDVFELPDTLKAIELINNQKIDLIICDINLPEQNGIDFSKKIREIDSKIPIILLSASTDKEFLLEATRLKLIDYLVKPIDFTILKNALDKVADEILSEGKYILNFENAIFYNFIDKKLYKTTIDNEIPLTSKELELLDFLILNNQRLISQNEIKEQIWEESLLATDSALKNLLNKLRKKIGKNSIINTSGFGYKIHFNN